jgi:hypothetical protein
VGSIVTMLLKFPDPLVALPPYWLITYQVTTPQGGVTDDRTVRQVIDALGLRMDPADVGGTRWRAIGGGRLEVRKVIRYPAALAAREEFEKGVHRLVSEDSVPRQVREFLDANAPRRAAILAAQSTEMARRLEELASAKDAHQQAGKDLAAAKASGDPESVSRAEETLANAYAALREKEAVLARSRITRSRIEAMLLPPLLSARRPPYPLPPQEDPWLLAEQAQVELKKEHSSRAREIDEVLRNYGAWLRGWGVLDDPCGLDRHIARQGRLSFRIGAGQRGLPISESQRRTYVNLLNSDGAEQGAQPGDSFAWFPIVGSNRREFQGLVVERHGGRWWMLLSNLPGTTMLDDQGWAVVAASVATDAMGRPAIDFRLDQEGGRRLYALTSACKGKALAILLGGDVCYVLTVQSAISDRGQITGSFSAPTIRSPTPGRGLTTGSFTDQDVWGYVYILSAGALPARATLTRLSMQQVPGGNGPQAGIKWALLVGVGLVALASLLLGFRCVVRSRVGSLGPWAIVAAVAAAAWWYLAVWNTFRPRPWSLWVMAAIAAPLVPLVIVWVTALLAARRQ